MCVPKRVALTSMIKGAEQGTLPSCAKNSDIAHKARFANFEPCLSFNQGKSQQDTKAMTPL